MKLRHFYTTVGLLLLTLPIRATQSLKSDTTRIPSSHDTIPTTQQVDLGYIRVNKASVTGAVAVLQSKDFNRGNMYDPTQLWVGRVAGLRISNRGGDPSSKSIMQIRGLSSLQSDASPLVVIDGVPAATLDNVDPFDIESITVLKDASAAALYGMRGSNGVLLVTTKAPKRNGKVSVEYDGYMSRADVYRTQPSFSPAEYIEAGGNNLGSATNWQKAITQTGFSNGQHIGISSGDARNMFRFSGNFRNVRGALQKSGFDQINIRGLGKVTSVDGRMTVSANFSYTDRKSNFSFPEAFKYATQFNPTAPVYNSSGDYFQAILYDNYNPVALLNQNISIGKKSAFNYNVKGDFAILNNLTFTLNVGQQSETSSSNTYYSRKSLYQGFNANGLAQRTSAEESFTFIQAHAFYSGTINNGSKYSLLAGYAYQNEKIELGSLQGVNFPNDDGFSNINNATGFLTNIYTSSPQRLSAFFVRGNLDLNNRISVNGSLRNETSSRLGSEHKNGLFGSVGMSVDLLRNIAASTEFQLKARLGYGIAGSVPTQGASYSITPGPIRLPDLKFEKLNEINFGLDFVIVSKISGSVELYNSKASDLILVTPAEQYKNVGGLRSRGIEVTVNYNSIEMGKVRWSPALVLSSNRQILDAYYTDQEMRSFADGPGMGGTQLTKVAVGQKIGQLWGPVFDGVNPNGSQKFKDINGDGVINASAISALSPTGDFTTLGNGLPTLELGWSNLFTFKRWELTAFFRGAFGQSLLNSTRMFNEPLDPGAIITYNRISTNRAVAGLTYSQYSSLYVERADFVKLDNLMVSYRLDHMKTRWLKNFRFSVGTQNLFVITKYTGTDPEPILADPLPTGESDPLVSGVDRRVSYYPVRTLTIGVSLGL